MYLFGAGGHAKVVKDIVQLCGGQVQGFYDNNSSISEFAGVPILGSDHEYKPDGQDCIISIGSNTLRKKVVAGLKRAKYGIAIHPNSQISESCKIGMGTVVMAGTVLNADAAIGNHCIINTSANLDHDCILEDFVQLGPNSTVCGGVTIEEGSMIGAGATVIPNIKIGKWSQIGAGSVVIEDIPDYAVAVGNPAKVIKLLDAKDY
ncbi:MAG: acetyltransferase [Bacteroidota bacterium]